MRGVLTIHGVGTFGGRGPWQDSVEKVLGPHFKCTAIKYSHYRWLGLFTAVIEPWVLAAAVMLVAFLRLVQVLAVTWPWLIPAFAVSVLGARVRHHLCLRNFLSENFRNIPLGGRPHIIAHSMGTKLVGTILRKYPQTRFANVVFAGCVLPTDYPWWRIARSNPARLNYVRNEVGGRDAVPALAHLGAKLQLLPGFGPAGSKGFDDSAGLIHTVPADSSSCAKCAILGTAVPVHNVLAEEFGHSTVFDSPSYAASFWLPFLWGIEPSEYSDFLELCFMCDEHHQTGNWPAYCSAEEKLLDTVWNWAEGKSLRSYIEEMSKKYPTKVAIAHPVVGQILRKVWQDVVLASRAHQERGAEWKKQIVALHPTASVIGAVDAILG